MYTPQKMFVLLLYCVVDFEKKGKQTFYSDGYTKHMQQFNSCCMRLLAAFSGVSDRNGLRVDLWWDHTWYNLWYF